MSLNFYKVTSLPGTLVANSFYFVENGTFAESYVTDDAGVAKSIGNTPMIESIATALITTQLATLNRIEIVANIAARDALNGADRNQLILVTDATGDATVSSGAALYVFRNSDNTFIKVAEYESMDFSLTWAAISGKPSSAPSLIDDAVTKRHDHTNKAALDKISEIGGALAYDGNVVSGSSDWAQTDW